MLQHNTVLKEKAGLPNAFGICSEFVRCQVTLQCSVRFFPSLQRARAKTTAAIANTAAATVLLVSRDDFGRSVDGPLLLEPCKIQELSENLMYTVSADKHMARAKLRLES